MRPALPGSILVITIRLIYNLPIRGYVVYQINILNKDLMVNFNSQLTLGLSGVYTMTARVLCLLLPCLLWGQSVRRLLVHGLV